LSWRRLRILIEHLPPESATMTAIRNAHPDQVGAGKDPAEGRWSQTEMLLAQLVDELRLLRWLTLSINAEKGSRPEPPEPLPRPGVQGKKPKLTGQQYDFLWRHINGLPTEESGLHLQVIDGGGGG
jgi:hypothetical protein